jgi:hypothetical protein
VESNGQTVPLYQLLAARLAERLKVDGEPSQLATLNQVALRYLERGEDLERVYSALKAVMPADAELPVPEPLLKLARIEPLKLFVSTTFDNLLERAINQVRFEGKPKTKVIAYSYQKPSDLPSALGDLQEPTVFKLMGRLSAVAFEYAVTEEDVLEFVHSLQSHDRAPKALFDELTRNHVLIIGSGFSDWLARFFIRLPQNDHLWMARGNTIIADQRTLEDGALRDFLRLFNKRTRVYQAGAAAFVEELAARWHPQRESEAPPAPSPIKSDAVFISYASEDRSHAVAISQALEGAQIPVWYDRNQLKGGHDWEEEIKRAMMRCSLFAPIISKNTLTQEPRFFREEWTAAEELVRQLPRGRAFVVPVAVDDTSLDTEQVKRDFPKVFLTRQWERLPNGKVTDEFVENVKELFRQYKLSRAAS